jgi:hypothetical protein
MTSPRFDYRAINYWRRIMRPSPEQQDASRPSRLREVLRGLYNLAHGTLQGSRKHGN